MAIQKNNNRYSEWLKGFKKIFEQKENEKNHNQKIMRKYFGKDAKL